MDAVRITLLMTSTVPRASRSISVCALLDVHGNYSIGTSTTTSRGGGLGVQTTFDGKTSPIAISTPPGIDYLKQENGGPSQTSVSLDVNVQPGGNASVVPYVGEEPKASGAENLAQSIGPVLVRTVRRRRLDCENYLQEARRTRRGLGVKLSSLGPADLNAKGVLL